MTDTFSPEQTRNANHSIVEENKALHEEAKDKDVRIAELEAELIQTRGYCVQVSSRTPYNDALHLVSLEAKVKKLRDALRNIRTSVGMGESELCSLIYKFAEQALKETGGAE